MMTEKELHNLIKDDITIQNDLLITLGISDPHAMFNSEDQYPNGMFADFSILNGAKVYAIVELKGSDIFVTDFVRGTGQVYQYNNFIKQNLSIKSYDYTEAFTVLCFPSSLISDALYNIGFFCYPENCRIVEFNEVNHTFRIITKHDLDVFAGARGREMITVSPYYVRDNRIFELYLSLRYLQIKKLVGASTADRKKAELFLKQINTINNGNWRNAFIGLSSLSLIDKNNIPTVIGSNYANLPYEEFAFEIYDSYIKQYFEIILNSILLNQTPGGNMTLDEMNSSINSMYGGKEVLFLTDSQNRYLSSWLMIMKDDFGCIDFPSKTSRKQFVINYNITQFNKKAICAEIRKRSQAYIYIDRFNSLITI